MPDLTPNPDAYPRLRIVLEERWHRRRILRSLPGWRWWIVGLLLVVVFGLVALPFILPLGGPEPRPLSSLADPNGAFVSVDGETLYYVHAPGDGRPVVLIHGMGASTVTWQATIPALAAAGYDVYALDLLGFGLSDKGWDSNYSHAAQADRVVGFLDAMDIDRADIVGHSMGGSIATYIALDYPDRVDRLVLVSAAALQEDHATVPGLVFDLPFTRRWAQFGLRRILPSVAGDVLRGAVHDETVITTLLIELYKRPVYTPNWDTGLLAIVRDGGKSSLPAPVSDIQARTLILWGADDSFVPPGDGARLEVLIPNAERIVFPGTGHLPMHEVPDDFNAVLIAFLDQTQQAD
ncbi:MAG: alpha/beta fold hydrolase [Anaerolineae bacterium]|nr:alpha/beta fold hydrolase [Anaerolineae bacterium]